MSVYVRLALKSSEGTSKITSQHHFPPDEGAVSVLIAGLGEGDDEGMAMDYPAYRVTHGNFAGDVGSFAGDIRKAVKDRFLFGHAPKMC